jgi:RNA polymerase sigma factor (sigma-70 family)
MPGLDAGARHACGFRHFSKNLYWSPISTTLPDIAAVVRKDTRMGTGTSELPGINRHDIETLFIAGTVTGLTDGQLLGRLTHRRDDAGRAAFTALVKRHGPMVLRVCGGVLGNRAYIEDAFQATFMVLARRASSIRDPDALGSWLYGVALRIASNQRAAAMRRQIHERRFAALRPAAATAEDRSDLEPALLEEVDRLPEKYRAPVVLCYLEGLTHQAAARRLSWPLGTVEGRLARARALLRSRLTRRGVAPAIGLLAGSASRNAAPVRLSRPWIDSTTEAALRFASDKTAASGATSARAVMLAQGVLRAAGATAITMAAAVLMAVILGAALIGMRGLFTQDSRGVAQPGKTKAQAVPAPVRNLRVLQLSGPTFNWESRFLARALEAAVDIQLDRRVARQPAREGKGGLEDALFKPGGYDAYILDDIPAAALTRRQQELLEVAVKRGAGLIILGGPSSFGSGGWADTAVAQVLPVELRPDDGLNAPDGRSKFVLTDVGLNCFFLQVGRTAAETKRIWQSLPPISRTNRFGIAKATAIVLAQTPEGDALLVTQDIGNRGRVLALGAELWMWPRSGDEGRATYSKFWQQALRWVGHRLPPQS